MQFQTRQQLAGHYAQVRKRLWYSEYKPPAVKAIPAPVKKVEVTNVELVGPWSNRKPRWRQIIEEVCAKHGKVYGEIIGPSQFDDVCQVRFECFYRLRTETGLSWVKISNCLGRTDHSTALHGYRKYKAKLEAMG